MKNTGLLAAVYGFLLFAIKTINMEITIPEYTVTADELFSDFNADEYDAMVKYKDNFLQVSGKIIKVSKTDSDSEVILKAGGDTLMERINCSFLKLDADLKKDDVVTIKGICQGYLTSVIMNNCVLVK